MLNSGLPPRPRSSTGDSGGGGSGRRPRIPSEEPVVDSSWLQQYQRQPQQHQPNRRRAGTGDSMGSIGRQPSLPRIPSDEQLESFDDGDEVSGGDAGHGGSYDEGEDYAEHADEDHDVATGLFGRFLGSGPPPPSPTNRSPNARSPNNWSLKKPLLGRGSSGGSQRRDEDADVATGLFGLFLGSGPPPPSPTPRSPRKPLLGRDSSEGSGEADYGGTATNGGSGGGGEHFEYSGYDEPSGDLSPERRAAAGESDEGDEPNPQEVGEKGSRFRRFGRRKKKGEAERQLPPNVVSELKLRAVNYDTEDHVGVLSQMHGSVWPKVFPYCVCNLLLTLLVYYLRKYNVIDLSFSDRGHTFMSMMVSFLVVTRSNIAYSRYMEARDDLTVAMKSCRELVQHAITFSRYESSDRARQWRAEVARRTVVLLRTMVSVLEYQTKGQHAWKIPELTQDEKQALLLSVGKSNERSPMVLTMFMRATIASQVEFLEDPMHVNKELRMLAIVSEFVSAYHGLIKLVTTPFPFPLVQMARTFLFVWVFSLPCALVNDIVKLPALLLLIFFITYGFIGLELVSIEMDDPFGDDPNDFDVLGLAKVVFEDIYIAIYDIDGRDAAMDLRSGIEAPLVQLTKSTVASHGHQRYCSIDAWKFSAPVPKHAKVGTDRSVLLYGNVGAATAAGRAGGGASALQPQRAPQFHRPSVDAGLSPGPSGGLDLRAVLQNLPGDPLNVGPSSRPPRAPGMPPLHP